MNDVVGLYLIGYLITILVMNYNMYRDNNEWTLFGILGWIIIAIAIWWFLAVVWLWSHSSTLVVYSRKR